MCLLFLFLSPAMTARTGFCGCKNRVREAGFLLNHQLEGTVTIPIKPSNANAKNL